MHILPLMYLDNLDDKAIACHNCSDRIWIHRSAFGEWISPDAGTVTFVQLQNRLAQTVVGCMYGVHQGDVNTLYVPQWMYEALDFDTEEVELIRSTPSMCTGIVLQPHTSDHIDAAAVMDPQEFLRDGFERYSALTPGQTLDIWVGGDEGGDGGHPMTCTVLRLHPTNETLAIRNCEMTLELMIPLDTPIPAPPMATTIPVLPIFNEVNEDAVSDASDVYDSSDPHTQPLALAAAAAAIEEDPIIRRQRAAEAARARFLGGKK
jgi:hypothetical protein